MQFCTCYIAPPWWLGPDTRIASGAEAATVQHKECLRDPSNNLYVYTDGSGIDGHVGAAAVSPLIRDTKIAYMGNNETTTVYVAELQGIKMALQIAAEDWERGNRRDKVVIFTDNQAAIKTFQNPLGGSGAYIAANVVSLINKLQNDRRLKVEIRWVPAHTGIGGNETADRAAKAAARQDHGACQAGTAFIQARTYHLQTTLKTWIAGQARGEWEKNWDMDRRGRSTYKYTPKPTDKILRLHRGLKKWQSALLIQMRTEKIGLRDHLWKRRVPGYDNPGCDCGEGRQTVGHILMRCRNYRHLRRKEFRSIGRMDLRAILNEPKLATRAIRFMEQTHLLGQFRRCVTEQTDEVEHWGETQGRRTLDG